jgi:hypothetical protein
MRTLLLPVLATAALVGCKWTEFDDLSGETWVGSTEKPSVKSSDYGVAIQRGTLTSASGGTLVVIGANQASYSQLVYGADGSAKLASNTVELNTQFGIGNLDAQPIVLADPTSDNTALLVNGGGSQVLALIGPGQLDQYNLFVTPSTVDAATYMQPPMRPDTNQAQPARPLVASGEVVIGVTLNPQPIVTGTSMHPVCRLLDGATAITPRALGTVRSGMFDDILAWGTSGKLYRYGSNAFNGCAPPLPPQNLVASHDTGFAPGHGSQILTVDATHVLLQGHHDNDDAAVLQVYDATTLAPVGGSVSLPKLRTAAILDLGTDKYVVAGYPAQIVDGKSSGQVLLFKVSATGIETSPSATLNDAQPEDNQSFGRAVAVMPFNGKPIIAVAADNEIFVYFRANLTSGTPLYNETRQGR